MLQTVRPVLAPVAVLVLIGLAWLGWRDARAAIVVLISGAAALGLVGLLSATRTPWPDLSMPWALIINPYLIATWGFVGTAAGTIGAIRHGLALVFRWRARRDQPG